MTEAVTVVETVRDAWQGLPHAVPTDAKRGFLRALLEAGFDRIDVGSFVSRRKVPAMADTDVLLDGLAIPDGVTLTGLVATERGLERLLAVPAIGEVLFPFSLSDSFGRRNIGQTREESADVLARLVRLAEAEGRRVYVTISMAFGNNEGDAFSIEDLCDWIGRLHGVGAARIALADTTAVATADTLRQVYAAVSTQAERSGHDVPGAHLHVTEQNQEALVWAALETGCRSFDAALGGLGGCQFAQGAVSNVSTEPLARQLQAAGFTSNLPAGGLVALDAAARRLAHP